MGNKLIKERRIFKESHVLFQSESSEVIEATITSIRVNRSELEDYPPSHPKFLYSLRPISIEATVPNVVNIMAESTRPLNFGPMAVIAGALADLVVELMREVDAKIAIIENGGEVSVHSERVFTVGLYAGRTKLAGTTDFQIESSECPIGVETSSATVSHAFSFGEADAATVFADTAALADAGATAVCNMVKSKGVGAPV